MLAIDRFQRFIADHTPADHAAWWELAAYWLVALLLGFLLASAFTFAVPRVMAGF
jgi:hypothetical protein